MGNPVLAIVAALLVGLVLGPVVLAIALSLFETFRHPHASSSMTATDMVLPSDSPYRARE